MEQGLATDIGICIIAAWVLAVISQMARQPLLLAYLAAGFLIGPHILGWVQDKDAIQTIASIGLALLLFMIGLEIDLKKMLSAGLVITLTALVQILGGVGLGFLVFSLVGPAKNHLEALYLAVAVAMSSTVIIIKILYDKRELESLTGRITVGVMVLQDMATILFLAVQPNLRHPAVTTMAVAVLHVILLVGLAYLVSRFVLPQIFRSIARLPELVLVGAVAWCFALAGLANYLNLSPAMGALIAGMMISTFPYTLDVVAKVTSLRDFFVTLFFVGLGMEIPLPTWQFMLWSVFVCLFLVISRLVTVFPTLHLLRQGYRTSLLPAINLSQMSELSLVLLALGKASGDVSDNTIGIAAFSFAFLAVGSTYGMLHEGAILRWARPQLNRLGLRDLKETTGDSTLTHYPKRICLLGFSWTASSLLEEINRKRPDLRREILVVDFNPQVQERLRQSKIHSVYGDITEREVLAHAGVAQAEVILCTLPNMVLKGADNLKMLRQLRELNSGAKIIVHAEMLVDVHPLYSAGASYVSVPRLLEAATLLEVIECAEKDLLHEKSRAQKEHVSDRQEVIP
jgi:Kef-type K+ transport system membrane component KefB